MKKDLSYFSHDEFAFYDARIELMFEKYGFAGYGRWWRVLEILRGQEEFKYNLKAEFAYKTLSQRLRLSIPKATELLNDFITFGLLQTDGEFVWSNSLIRRMNFLLDTKQRLSDRGRRGAEVTNAKRAAVRQQSDASESLECRPSAAIKEKKTKEKETKENKTKENEDEEKEIKPVVSSSASSSSVGGVAVSRDVFISPDWETLKQRALDDTMRFVYPYVSSGKVTKEQLAAWLDAFNRTLEFQAAPMKSEQDYRKHFASWFKYHDPKREKPEDLSPAPPNKVLEDPNRPQTFMRNVHELIAEQELRRQQEDEADRLEQERQRE